jgi:hypothetical protein
MPTMEAAWADHVRIEDIVGLLDRPPEVAA